jgi:two-component system response regulator VanR
MEVFMLSKTILIIDDEKAIQNVMKAFLEDAGYITVLADDGLDGIKKFHRYNPDLVLLDLMLPKIDGFAVCELIRKESQVPIIMLTARDDDDSQIKGFDVLADDYITKPVTMPLVIRRIEAVLRRTEKGNQNENTIIHYKEISLDIDSFNVFVNGESISLTTREFEILKLFLENQGRVFTRDNLLNTIWGYDYFGDAKIVNTHIKNIRRKLGVDYIETIRGVGYKIEKENQ